LSLAGCEGFAIDASVIEADASIRRKAEGKRTAWPEAEEVSRPVREYLDALDQAAAAEAKPATNADDDMPPACHYRSHSRAGFRGGRREMASQVHPHTPSINSTLRPAIAPHRSRRMFSFFRELDRRDVWFSFKRKSATNVRQERNVVIDT
jgi:hypothetical protein